MADAERERESQRVKSKQKRWAGKQTWTCTRHGRLPNTLRGLALFWNGEVGRGARRYPVQRPKGSRRRLRPTRKDYRPSFVGCLHSAKACRTVARLRDKASASCSGWFRTGTLTNLNSVSPFPWCAGKVRTRHRTGGSVFAFQPLTRSAQIYQHCELLKISLALPYSCRPFL